jgi:chromosomal replication initiator protein
VDIIWEKTVNLIKDKVSSQNFETWITPIKIISKEEGIVQLAVPNKFFRDWLTDNYINLIKDSLKAVTGIGMNVQLLINKDHGKDHSSPVTEKDIQQTGSHLKKTHKTKSHSSLNPNYSFDRFVVGPCNQFAHAASIAVSEQPAKNYNPLFIYSDVGLGKTHLLNAVGLLTLSIYSDMNVVYVSAEEFMNELINAIRYDKMPKFREKYRKIDCLLIDDIQFIAGKERTQEEFFHTFNTLHDSGKQIVVTSDKFPKDIPNLEDRLRSRFEWGLIADIQPPEIETKVAILEKKAYESNIQLPTNVAHYIASNAESNIRELEGFLVRISAFSSVTGQAIDMDLVKEVLKKFLKNTEKEEVSIEEITKVVAGYYGIKLSDLKSHKKNKNIALARQIAMYLSRKLTMSSFPDIGGRVGGRDHSTVIYAYNKIKNSLEEDNKLKKCVQDIEYSILNRS